jgi:hypothetical protein
MHADAPSMSAIPVDDWCLGLDALTFVQQPEDFLHRVHSLDHVRRATLDGLFLGQIEELNGS